MNITSYTASDARQNFYSLIRQAATGLGAIEINLRNTDPVVMVSKADYESWLETLDVMSSPEEMRAIREGRQNRQLTPLSEVKKMLGI